MSQGVGVDNATALAEIAITLRDVLDDENANVTQSTYQSALRVVDRLSDIRRQYPSTPIHADELRVTTTVWLLTSTPPSHSTFYPHDAMLARSLRQQRVCPSVCLSVCHTPVLSLAERKQDREMYSFR